MASDNVPWAPKGDETLPRRRRLAIIIAVLLVVGAGVLVGPLILRPLPDESKDMPPATFETPRGTFRPTPQEWAGLRLERVTIRTFRTEKMAEGIIAIDDNLTTPVFCHYSGHVMKLIAKPGDHVEPGAPLFEIEASEFVQAQNDLITALANLQSGRSQLALAQINEKRAHELYSANGGALKDWQQAQTNLIAAENTVRADEIALHTVRRRLRILGKTDDEIASLEAQPTQKLNAVTIVTAPIAGTITQRQVGIGQYVASLANGATTPVYTISDLSTVWADRQCARGGHAIDACWPFGRGPGAGVPRPCLQSEDLLGCAVDRSEYSPSSCPRRCRKPRRCTEARDVCGFQHHYRGGVDRPGGAARGNPLRRRSRPRLGCGRGRYLGTARDPHGTKQ